MCITNWSRNEKHSFWVSQLLLQFYFIFCLFVSCRSHYGKDARKSWSTIAFNYWRNQWKFVIADFRSIPNPSAMFVKIRLLLAMSWSPDWPSSSANMLFTLSALLLPALGARFALSNNVPTLSSSYTCIQVQSRFWIFIPVRPLAICDSRKRDYLGEAEKWNLEILLLLIFYS